MPPPVEQRLDTNDDRFSPRFEMARCADVILTAPRGTRSPKEFA